MYTSIEKWYHSECIFAIKIAKIKLLQRKHWIQTATVILFLYKRYPSIKVTTGHLYQRNRERKTILGNMEHKKNNTFSILGNRGMSLI